LAEKVTWLPPGKWVDVNTGVVTTVETGDGTRYVTKQYAINQIPLWYSTFPSLVLQANTCCCLSNARSARYVAGAVIPYLPLRSLPTSVGNAGRQYTFLGFKIVPGEKQGSVAAYEDDGTTTAYLTKNAFARTTCQYNMPADGSYNITISTAGTYPELPSRRAYQVSARGRESWTSPPP
jgi:hypothetical protein